MGLANITESSDWYLYLLLLLQLRYRLPLNRIRVNAMRNVA
jgi:hypothetical protein